MLPVRRTMSAGSAWRQVRRVRASSVTSVEVSHRLKAAPAHTRAMTVTAPTASGGNQLILVRGPSPSTTTSDPAAVIAADGREEREREPCDCCASSSQVLWQSSVEGARDGCCTSEEARPFRSLRQLRIGTGCRTHRERLRMPDHARERTIRTSPWSDLGRSRAQHPRVRAAGSVNSRLRVGALSGDAARRVPPAARSTTTTTTM